MQRRNRFSSHQEITQEQRLRGGKPKVRDRQYTSGSVMGVSSSYRSQRYEMRQTSRHSQGRNSKRPVSLANLCYMETAVQILEGSGVLNETETKSEILDMLKGLRDRTFTWEVFVYSVKEMFCRFNTTEQGDVWDFLRTVYSSDQTNHLEQYFFLETETIMTVTCCSKTEKSSNLYPLITVYPAEGECSTKSLFEDFFKAKPVRGAVCSWCGRKTEMILAETIIAAPQVISMQISRWSDLFSRKNTNRVHIDTELTVKGDVYELFGLIIHSGERTSSGHYSCLRRIENDWYSVDGGKNVRRYSPNAFGTNFCGAFYRRVKRSEVHGEVEKHRVEDYIETAYWILKCCGIFEEQEPNQPLVLKLIQYLFEVKQRIPWEESVQLLNTVIKKTKHEEESQNLWDFLKKICLLQENTVLSSYFDLQVQLNSKGTHSRCKAILAVDVKVPALTKLPLASTSAPLNKVQCPHCNKNIYQWDFRIKKPPEIVGIEIIHYSPVNEEGDSVQVEMEKDFANSTYRLFCVLVGNASLTETEVVIEVPQDYFLPDKDGRDVFSVPRNTYGLFYKKVGQKL